MTAKFSNFDFEFNAMFQIQFRDSMGNKETSVSIAVS